MENQNITPILEVAWRKFAQYDATSVKRTSAYNNLRKWIAALGILATLFAILSTLYQENLNPIIAIILKILLVLSPIIASGLAAYTNEFFSSGDWLVARAGAEEILKHIYLYRTILRDNPRRREWLEKKLAKIQRSVFSGMNGELVMETYKEEVPPPSRFNTKDPNGETGFHDLSGDEYFKFRLENELNWHIKKVNQKQRERKNLQRLIYISAGLGAALAAFGDSGLAIWVALTASFTSAFLGWQQLKNLDLVVRNYSKIIMELSIISDHWKNLDAEERTQSEVYRMVNSTEEILWSRNVEYIKAMQEALKESGLDEEASLINRVIQEQRESDKRSKQNREDSIIRFTKQKMDEASEELQETFDNALGKLAEEASSDVVQAELAAMRQAIQTLAGNIAERLGLSTSLQSIAEEYEEVEISGQTPQGVLNDLISRYPKTNEIKG
ncbi:MAG: SLATT domain-containing protein [Anaerolineales bacterium]|nr:SLATT domain-containing protein [Anaerolineales bacterium]